jgi:hypothetical protein
VFFALQDFNFGLKSAVVQFNRLSGFMARAAVRLLGLILANFFDDFCVIEPAFSKGGQSHLRAFASLIRVPFAGAFLGDQKSMAPSIKGAFLGVEHDYSNFASTGKITSKVSDDSISKTIASMRSILAYGSFSGCHLAPLN